MKKQYSKPVNRIAALASGKWIALAACAGILTSSLTWAGPPDVSGKVVRLVFEDSAALWFYDGDRSHFLGINPVEVCATGDFSSIDDLAAQAILIPGDTLRISLTESVTDAYAGVWEDDLIGDGSPAAICSSFEGPVQLVAEGTVNYRYQDNNISWADECNDDVSPTHTNAWGEGWNGVLTDSYGQPAPYMGVYRATWQSCDPSTWKETAQLRLRTSNGS